MKTETKLARENIEQFEIEAQTGSMPLNKRNCQEHKQACQRFLKFLENFYRNCKKEKTIFEIHDRKDIEEKIQDLKTAIKLYKDEGI